MLNPHLLEYIIYFGILTNNLNIWLSQFLDKFNFNYVIDLLGFNCFNFSEQLYCSNSGWFQCCWLYVMMVWDSGYRHGGVQLSILDHHTHYDDKNYDYGLKSDNRHQIILIIKNVINQYIGSRTTYNGQQSKTISCSIIINFSQS